MSGSDPIDSSCDGCNYNRMGNEGNCSRYVKFENGRRVLCGTENNLGDEGENCLINTCPEHCFLYDELLANNKYYGDEEGIFGNENDSTIKSVEELFSATESQKILFTNGINTYVDLINDGPYNPDYKINNFVRDVSASITGASITDLEISANCLAGVSCSSDDISIINNNKGNSGIINFVCGDTSYNYGDFKLPNVGGDPLINQNTISRLANNTGSMFQGIKWNSLNSKYRDNTNLLIIDLYNVGLLNRIEELEELELLSINNIEDYLINIGEFIINNSNDYIIYHQNGIDFTNLSEISEWKNINNDTSDPELSRVLSINNLTVNDLDNIYEFSTGKMRNFLTDIIITDLTDQYDSKVSYDQITEYGNRRMMLMGISDIQDTNLSFTRFIDIFMITKDDAGNNDLESKLNTLLDTGESDEDAFISRIANYTNIEELGASPKDVKFIERKIKKFLGTDTDDFVDVFLQSNLQYESICSEGFSSRPMEMLGNVLKLDIDENVTEKGLFEEKYVVKKLLKYVPSLMRKVLDISEKYELETCDRVTKKTQLYKEIYKDLFIESNVLKFELPDLGISEFFSDFNRNIYTKIILLVFIGFIISRIISLFSFNVGVTT